MSTRRARIKAVAALPVRRRNNETGDKKSNNENVKVSSIKESKTAEPPETKLDNSIDIDPNTVKDDKNMACEIIIEIETEHSGNDIDVNIGNSEVALSEGAEDILNKTIESVLGIEHIYIVEEKVEESSKDTLNKAPEVSEAPTLVVSDLNQQITSTEQIVNKDANCNNSTMVLGNQEIELVTDSLITDVDYNPPSIPESITEDTIMDGIVPLQSAPRTPKPVQVLKSQIISENAEVLFDPIVPLPSPSKIRPKLRPTPRLNPVRRNSIQGSASESEDENRRTLLSSGAQALTPARQRHDSHTSHSTMYSVPNRDPNRNRNDSVCSSVSHIAAQTPHSVSPLKEKLSTNTRRRETSRKLAAMRRRREAVKRETLTMYDLIFYNPTNNPIVPDEDEVAAIEANKRDEAERRTVAEAAPYMPEEPEAEAAPVPRVKLGPNGEIILDEKSLVIQQTRARRALHPGAVREGAWSAGGGRYTRGPRTADWSALETVRYYRALAAVGTDFSLMTPLFPGRTRRDLKIKFKKEEKLNMAQVDMALRSATSWNVTEMQERFSEERAAEARSEREQQVSLERRRREERARAQHVRSMRLKNSRGSKAMETTVVAKVDDRLAAAEATTADAIIRRELEQRARARASRPRAKKRPSAADGAKTTPPNQKAARRDTSQPTDSGATTTPNQNVARRDSNQPIGSGATTTPNQNTARRDMNQSIGSGAMMTPNQNAARRDMNQLIGSGAMTTPNQNVARRDMNQPIGSGAMTTLNQNAARRDMNQPIGSGAMTTPNQNVARRDMNQPIGSDATTTPNQNAARRDMNQPIGSGAMTTPNQNTARRDSSRPISSGATTPRPTAGNVTPVTVPANIETGSLVVLTVNDPSSPSKKMLQTYISEGSGKLTPVALSSTFLNSVVGYMKKTPKGGAPAGLSPQLASPVAVAGPEGRDGRTSATPNLTTISLSPMKRPRLGSYTIMQL